MVAVINGLVPEVPRHFDIAAITPKASVLAEKALVTEPQLKYGKHVNLKITTAISH